MMTFVGRFVIAINRPVILGLDQEVIVESSVLEIMDAAGQKPGKDLKFTNKFSDSTFGKQAMHGLNNICNVCSVVIRIVLVPTFDCSEEVDKLDLVKVELFYQVVLHEHVPAQNL
mmetsp:Transcript_14261/g.32828  ORF Transcript_14261/g.32828 Transcript_14261/m.32828 type:complete len:115 (+) Transcript_14261:613-957(+)